MGKATPRQSTREYVVLTAPRHQVRGDFSYNFLEYLSIGKPVAIQYMILFPFILCRSYEALIGTVSHDTFDWLSDKQSRSEGVESGVGNRGSGTGGILTGPPGEVHIPIFTLFRDFK